MEQVRKMLSIPLDFPSAVMEFAERDAQGNARRCGYLQAVDDDIVLRVFMYRKLKGKQLEITEVQRRTTRAKKWAIKNIYGSNMSGYHAVYEEKDKKSHYYGYCYTLFDKEDFDVWHIREDNVLNLWFSLINADMLKDTRFKYCGYSTKVCDDVIGYLNNYIEHPSVEYFGKLGIKPSPTLIKKAEKDKAFRNWLYKTKIDVICGPQAIIYAYEHNIGVDEARGILKTANTLRRYVRGIRRTNINLSKIAAYINDNKISYTSYSDYLEALIELRYDLNDTKNILPRDFKRMHDLRIAEYDSVMAKKDKNKRAQLHADFERASQEARRFEFQDESYAAIIPGAIQELVQEGRALHHCVGKMGYDKKMADGDIVIVLVRSITDLTKPLATIEYDLNRKIILQSHVDFNGTPKGELATFIDKWEKRTTKLLKTKAG